MICVQILQNISWSQDGETIKMNFRMTSDRPFQHVCNYRDYSADMCISCHPSRWRRILSDETDLVIMWSNDHLRPVAKLPFITDMNIHKHILTNLSSQLDMDYVYQWKVDCEFCIWFVFITTLIDYYRNMVLWGFIGCNMLCHIKTRGVANTLCTEGPTVGLIHWTYSTEAFASGWIDISTLIRNTIQTGYVPFFFAWSQSLFSNTIKQGFQYI